MLAVLALSYCFFIPLRSSMLKKNHADDPNDMPAWALLWLTVDWTLDCLFLINMYLPSN